MMKNDILPYLHMVMSLYEASLWFQSLTIVIFGIRSFLAEKKMQCINGPSIKRCLYPLVLLS